MPQPTYRGLLIPRHPTVGHLRDIAQDYEAVLVTVMAALADRYDRTPDYPFIDTKLGHSCISRDGRRNVSDVQDAKDNELYLVDLVTGTSEVLCWPDSTLQDGTVGHVHPSFNFAGDGVIYTSDKPGKAAVFIVPVRTLIA